MSGQSASVKLKRACVVFALCAATVTVLPAQAYTTLYSFDGSDGAGPVAGLVQATDGYFYGTTDFGGTYSRGTIFKISPRGELTTLHNLCFYGGGPDGGSPTAGLVQASNGELYGTTSSEGALQEENIIT